ncbi:MAG TPA: glycosyltransferase family 2 protein [bacterium]|nr:glycosyltransferase family 2 protein [bacterium]
MANEPAIHDSLTVLIPCFNEEAMIAATARAVHNTFAAAGVACELIIINDGSTDGTAAQVAALDLPVRVLTNPHCCGYGFSLKRGLRAATRGWIAIIDADGTYPVERFPDLWAQRREFDMIVGARTGERVSIPTLRKPAKWFIGQLANYLAGQRIPDLNSGMRIFRRDLALTFVNILPDGFSFTTTITLAALTSGHLVQYLPIDYFKRHGESKIRFYHTLDFSLLVVRLITYFKPLKIFFPIAGLFVTLGLARLLVRLADGASIGEATILLIVAGIQIGLIGLLADMLVKSRGVGR